MNSRLKKILKYSLSIAVAILLLWVSFKGVDWKMFWLGLKSCRWGFVIISMLIGALSFYFRGLRWRQLLLTIDPSTSRLTCFNAVNISYIANMVLPRVGEFIRCGYVHRHSQKMPNGKRMATYDKIFGTGLVDRIWDVMTMIIFLVGVMFFTWDRFGDFFHDKLLAPISAKLNFNVSWMIVLVVALLIAFIWACIHFRKKSRFFGKIYEVCAGILQGMRTCLLAKNWWMTMIHSICVWLCYWMTSYTVVLAVQGINPAAFPPEMASGIASLMDLDVMDALFLMIVGSISTVVPVPGGFGAYHYLLTLGLSAVYGIPSEIGIIYATLSHESQVLIQIICGCSSYGYEAMIKVK